VTPMYRVEVTAESGECLNLRDCGSLEIARRHVALCREEYPDAQWITVNRRKDGRVTAMVSMTVFKGSTALERRMATCEEIRLERAEQQIERQRELS
jgi:hypothetical protein